MAPATKTPTKAPSKTKLRRIGLNNPNCPRIRKGEQTRLGEMGDDIMCSMAIQAPMPKEAAEIVWASIPEEKRNKPDNKAQADAFAYIGKFAEATLPDGLCQLMDDKHKGVEYYSTPGSPFIRGLKDSRNFPTFVWNNMDVGARIKWYNMTGAEQYEWYDAYETNSYTDQRVANTVGLRGTEVKRIKSPDALKEAFDRSPSLMRRTRPDGHPLTVQQWETTRRLFQEEMDDDASDHETASQEQDT